MLRAGLTRALRLLAAVAAATAVVSLIAGLVVGASPGRALSVGWICAGALVLLLGFGASVRGPMPRGAGRRWATRAEQEEALNLSAALVAIGLLLVVLGVLADRRHPLF
jgi:hypothetical protein